MKITTLVENNRLSEELTEKHGLSIHIKTTEHSILFDLGPDDTFLKNAEKLNINIEEVDIVVISHGHSDHGGGLETFLNYNKKAKVYINENAFEKYYASIKGIFKFYIGLDLKFKENNRIILTNDLFRINEDLTLFSNVQGDVLLPSANKNLLVKKNNKYIKDDFKHEQNLLINDSGNINLISGCSHCGIINILGKAEEISENKINIVIGGLHLFNPINKKTEDKFFIDKLANRLLNKELKIYTCHCTGLKAFELLKETLGDNINKISTGTVLNI